MATWTYHIKWKETMNYGIPYGNDASNRKRTVSMHIYRYDHTSDDASLYKATSGKISTNVDQSTGTSYTIKILNTNTLSFGGYFGLPLTYDDGNAHPINDKSINGIADNILNITSDGVTVDVSTDYGGNDNAVFFYPRNGYNTEYLILTLTVEDRYSASDFTTDSVYFDSDSTVKFVNSTDPNFSALSHTVQWYLDSGYSNSTNVGTNVDRTTYHIPSSWMANIPNDEYKNCTVTVTTKKGSTQIGQPVQKTIVLTVPPSVKPSFSALVVDGTYNQFSNQYLQNRSGVRLKMNDVTANGYATIQSIQCTCSAAEGTPETNLSAKTFIYNPLKNAGTLTFSATVTDSRGRVSNSQPQTITVLAYSPPSFVSSSAYRCKQNGIADEQGTYANIRTVAVYSEISGNSLSISSQYYESLHPSTMYTGVNDMTSGNDYTIGSGTLQVNLTYYVRFTISDTVGNTATKDVVVQTAAYAIHVRNGGSGVAFGKASEHDNAVDINEGWELYLKNFAMLPFVYKASIAQRDAIQNPPEGLVCLIPKT